VDDQLESLRFLADTALGFLELPVSADIYQAIADGLNSLVGDAVILVNSYDGETRSTETRVVRGLGSRSERLLKVLGRDPVGLRLAIDDVAATNLRSGRIQRVGGIRQLSFGRLPRAMCTALEDLFKLGEIWSIGFTTRGELLGSLSILLRRGSAFPDIPVVEAFVHQAAVALLRVRAEDARRESEAKAAAAFSASPDSILISRLSDGAVIEVNESFLCWFGHTREECIGANAGRLQSWERLEDLVTFQKALRRRGEVSNFETVLRSSDGGLMYALVSGRIIEIGGEECVLSIARDISDRKDFEKQLKASHDLYRTIFENKGTATAIVDADDTVSLVNSKTAELWGEPKEKIEGRRKWTDFVVEEDLPRLQEYRSFRALDDGSAPESYEFRARRADGQIRNVLTTIDVIPGRDKIVASFLDVTALKRAEEELQRAAKLESLGLLAGGIAHDFNNLLGALLGNLSLAREALDSGEKPASLSRYLEASEKAVLRARDLTNQLLTFSKGGAPVKRPASLAGVLQDSVLFVLSGSQHQPNFQIAPALRTTRVDPGQISQVIQNLVLNAAQSMTEPGTITVTAANVNVRPSGDWLPLPPGDYVRVQVIDQGCGIPPEDLQRVFDPFFTTRPGTGSGLGLTTAYRIVKQHQGLMTVDSSLHQGSTLTFYLPADEAENPAAPAEPQTKAPPAGRVLVVDDEETLRQVVSRMLGRLGQAAVAAAGAEEAIALFEDAKAEGRPFDLVITDLTMPGGAGGVELAGRLLSLQPDVRIVATSGYATDPVMSDPRAWGFASRLPKPFNLAELEAVLCGLQRD
jgi:PAS domain S-box-containing protein